SGRGVGGEGKRLRHREDLLDAHPGGERPCVRRLDDAAIGNRIAVREPDFDERRPARLRLTQQPGGRPQVRIAGGDERYERLLAFGFQASEELVDGVHWLKMITLAPSTAARLPRRGCACRGALC